MKPLDLIRLYVDFKEAMQSHVPSELKLRVALEVSQSLPPVALCAPCPATREWLGNAVQDVIDTLQAEYDRANKPVAETPQDEAPTVRHRKARKEPLGE